MTNMSFSMVLAPMQQDLVWLQIPFEQKLRNFCVFVTVTSKCMTSFKGDVFTLGIKKYHTCGHNT